MRTGANTKRFQEAVRECARQAGVEAVLQIPGVWEAVQERFNNEALERMRNRPVEFELEDCGVHHAQYFRGRGTTFTRWTECFVGMGCSAREAAEDAAEQAAMTLEIDTIEGALDRQIAALPGETSREIAEADRECAEDGGDHELYHYVALYTR